MERSRNIGQPPIVVRSVGSDPKFPALGARLRDLLAFLDSLDEGNGGRSVDNRDDAFLRLHLFSVIVKAGGSGCSILILALLVPCDVPGEGLGIALTRLEERRGSALASLMACLVDFLLASFDRVCDCRDGDVAGGQAVVDGDCEGDLVARWLLDLLEVQSLNAKWRTECQ